MNDIDMKAMCDSAMVRVSGFIARSAGQHIRQMREQKQMTDSEFLSDLLFCGHMGELPESTIKEACERFGIDFPPKQFKGFQATHKAPVFQTSKVTPWHSLQQTQAAATSSAYPLARTSGAATA